MPRFNSGSHWWNLQHGRGHKGGEGKEMEGKGELESPFFSHSIQERDKLMLLGRLLSGTEELRGG